ncbi:hypothetical protein [Palleronia sp.]|uniref:hypothetical protein n=1 Tax=Palleronia sp. TaxID=1940284 RepID=UPI0035C80F23
MTLLAKRRETGTFDAVGGTVFFLSIRTPLVPIRQVICGGRTRATSAATFD